jgi:hypothetical protein
MAILVQKEQAGKDFRVAGLAIIPAVHKQDFLPMVIKNMVNYLIYNLFYGNGNMVPGHPRIFILWQKVVENRFTRSHQQACFICH